MSFVAFTYDLLNTKYTFKYDMNKYKCGNEDVTRNEDVTKDNNVRNMAAGNTFFLPLKPQITTAFHLSKAYFIIKESNKFLILKLLSIHFLIFQTIDYSKCKL